MKAVRSTSSQVDQKVRLPVESAKSGARVVQAQGIRTFGDRRPCPHFAATRLSLADTKRITRGFFADSAKMGTGRAHRFNGWDV
jgi:hypothetical protein